MYMLGLVVVSCPTVPWVVSSNTHSVQHWQRSVQLVMGGGSRCGMCNIVRGSGGLQLDKCVARTVLEAA